MTLIDSCVLLIVYQRHNTHLQVKIKRQDKVKVSAELSPIIRSSITKERTVD